MKIHRYIRRKRLLEILHGSLSLGGPLQYAGASKRVFYASPGLFTKRIVGRHSLFIQWLLHKNTKHAYIQKVLKFEFRLISAARFTQSHPSSQYVLYNSPTYNKLNLTKLNTKYNSSNLRNNFISNINIHDSKQFFSYQEAIRKSTSKPIFISNNMIYPVIWILHNKKTNKGNSKSFYNYTKNFMYLNESEILYDLNHNYSYRTSQNYFLNNHVVQYKQNISQNLLSCILSKILSSIQTKNVIPYKSDTRHMFFGKIYKSVLGTRTPISLHKTDIFKSISISNMNLFQSRQATNHHINRFRQMSSLHESKYYQISTRRVLVYEQPPDEESGKPPIPTFKTTHLVQPDLGHRVGSTAMLSQVMGQFKLDLPLSNGDLQSLIFLNPPLAGIIKRPESSTRHQELELSHKKQTTVTPAPREETLNSQPDEPSPLAKKASPKGIVGLPQTHQPYDLDDLTNQVMQKIESRLRTERERRGIFV